MTGKSTGKRTGKYISLSKNRIELIINKYLIYELNKTGNITGN